MSGAVVHSPGPGLVAALLMGCLVSALGGAFRERAERRRAELLVGGRPGRPSRRGCPTLPAGARTRSVRDRLLAAGVGLSVFVFLGGAAGCVVGLCAAVGVRRWRSSASTAADSDRTQDVEQQLPLACDLLAACLEAGAGPQEAAEAVGASLGGPIGERLRQVAAELRMGQEPVAAWSRLARLPGASGPARCLERAHTTGAPAAGPMARLAADRRTRQARDSVSRARRAGVLATAPLGLCFLPAFLLIGVAPVLIGLADGLMDGG
ncbi:type II secretion system F family protein [Streptomyces meridianus]|uniref:Type II secretion system F family protein n=1 Tax=Streptomyces meridianus TaxID=2938945 RepID=A0ABT0X582_9ACTN|nr:type II secretion system F family protein [Streptomyces meridianus]MCM2577702.1 type II secretion system F family protein [Streptomyces meridianus]